mgnify:CR=1 FL=1
MKATNIVMIGIIPLLMVVGACASSYQCPDGSKVAKLEQCKGKTPIERTKAAQVLKAETSPPEENANAIVRERQWQPKENDDINAKKKKRKANEELRNNGNNNTTQVSWEKFAVECAKQTAGNASSDSVNVIDACLLQYAVKYEGVIYCARINNGTAREICYQKLKDKAVELDENKTGENDAMEKKLVEKVNETACRDLGCPEGTLYTGSKNSDIYHECHCGFAKRITAENRVCFTAIPPGRRPSTRC